MFHNRQGPAGLTYSLCQYPGARVTYRGPPANLQRPYMAFIGASETFGPFVEAPFPTLIAEAYGVEVLNLGVRNAGPDVHLQSRAMLQLTSVAVATVVQVPLIPNLSNRFYRVHPRRNDRFLCITEELRALAPYVDLCDVNFIGHFWAELARQAPDVVSLVRQEVEEVWLDRMRLMLRHIKSPVYLLVIEKDVANPAAKWAVSRTMLDALRSLVSQIVHVRPSQQALREGRSTLMFSDAEFSKASGALNATAHKDVAHGVMAAMDDAMKKARA